MDFNIIMDLNNFYNLNIFIFKVDKVKDKSLKTLEAIFFYLI